MKIGFVYMLLVLPTFRIKVGQTAHLLKRHSDISESLPSQLVIPICIIFAGNYIEIEKHIHKVFDFCRYEYYGSGATEYFTTIIAITAILPYMIAIQLFKIIELLLYIAAIIFAIWVVCSLIIK